MYALITCGAPALLAIFIFTCLNAQIWLYTETDVPYFFEMLRFVYLVPALIFAYISDKNYRKGALLVSHILGLAASIILYFYGFSFWALLLFAIVFNPLSVARAALLDNFPDYSPLKLMSVTFIVQFLCWGLFAAFSEYGVPVQSLLVMTLCLLVANIFFIAVLFKDNKDTPSRSHIAQRSHYFQGVDRKVISILIAFILAETTISLLWGRIQLLGEHVSSWIAVTNLSLLFGAASAMLYKRLPHMSVVTLTYVVGVCMVAVSLLGHSVRVFAYEITFLDTMSHYSVLGGLYLPLVTDAVITCFGAHRKAFGAVMIDFAQAIALIFAAVLQMFVGVSFYKMAFIVLFLFIGASVIQRQVERHVSDKSALSKD